jgi:hypothetical protein
MKSPRFLKDLRVLKGTGFSEGYGLSPYIPKPCNINRALQAAEKLGVRSHFLKGSPVDTFTSQ